MLTSYLDNSKYYQKFDTHFAYASIEKISQQFEVGWHEASFTPLSSDISKYKSICFCGMGGSVLPAKIFLSLSPYICTLPITIVSNYRLPTFVNKNTLIVLISYSGNTEETLSCAYDCRERKIPAVVITTGGQLEQISKEQSWPVIKLDNGLNPSSLPRFGIGLTLGAVFGLVARLPGMPQYNPRTIIQTIERAVDLNNQNRPTVDNVAKQLALKYVQHSVIFFSANHLTGIGEAVKNFFNESAKTFSTSFEIPDLNHHLLEGLQFPNNLKDYTKFVLLDSGLYPGLIQKRFEITKEILSKQRYQVSVVRPEATSPINQAFESLAFFILVSYYLSIVNKVDPGTNPLVDYFKNHLKQ